jgi:hypothetical protein
MSVSFYLTRELDKENNKNFSNFNPFVVGAAPWQSLTTYWFNAYGELLKNAPKMTEDWYDTFWKPWINWTPQLLREQHQQHKDNSATLI